MRVGHKTIVKTYQLLCYVIKTCHHVNDATNPAKIVLIFQNISVSWKYTTAEMITIYEDSR